MSYDNDTLNILHGLTPEGQINYSKMLEQKADEILFKNKHPFKWLIARMLSLFFN